MIDFFISYRIKKTEVLPLATSKPPALRCRLGLDLHVVRVNNYLTQSQGVTFCSSAAVLLPIQDLNL